MISAIRQNLISAIVAAAKDPAVAHAGITEPELASAIATCSPVVRDIHGQVKSIVADIVAASPAAKRVAKELGIEIR